MTWPSLRDLRRAYNDLCWMVNDVRSQRTFAAGDVVARARPQFLIVDPTSICNARCVMCPVSFRAPDDHGVDLAPALFDKVTRVIAGASHVNLFATGEPTIARHLSHFLRETRRRTNSQIWVSTNGKSLPAALLDDLAAPRMGLQFSVDGGTKDVFETIRRGIRFEDLRRSLGMASERRQATGFPMLSFSCTMSKRNLHDLGNIFALAQEFGVDQVIFYDEDPESPGERAVVLDESDRPVFDAQRPFIDATRVRYANGLSFRGASPPSARGPLTCRAPWKVFYLRADGTVRTCCTLRSSMGDLSRASFDDVWNGPAYVALRRAFVEQSGIPDACFTCTDPLQAWTGAR